MSACINGCQSRPDADRNRHPIQADPPAVICTRCEDRLSHWLERIPDLYATLPGFVEPGSSDRNPESKSTKAAHPPSPVRETILDLLDTRRGRKWLGTEAADDYRGALGVLESWARLTREEKRIDAPASRASVYSEARLLSRHLLWICEQGWVDELYEEVRKLHRAISDAVSEYRPRPVGTCTVVKDEAEGECGGPLMPSKWGLGVHCPKCSTDWDADELRRLGLVLGESA